MNHQVCPTTRQAAFVSSRFWISRQSRWLDLKLEKVATAVAGFGEKKQAGYAKWKEMHAIWFGHLHSPFETSQDAFNTLRSSSSYLLWIIATCCAHHIARSSKRTFALHIRMGFWMPSSDKHRVTTIRRISSHVSRSTAQSTPSMSSRISSSRGS